ncbi:MAG: patatin-like phospholipase family protein [Acholeplasmatales bacterium]|nr:MAG: patatin-like phospholipase family protein [Acholeplasmatales bacterium]
MKRKLGVALSGGGARGAYQIGVLKTLQEAGMLDDLVAISGSSVGSLNAVLLAMKDLRIAENLWRNEPLDEIFVSDKNVFKRVFEDKLRLPFKGYYKTDKLEAIMDRTIDYDAIYASNVYVTTSHVGNQKVTLAELLSLNIRNMFDDIDHVRYTLLKELDRDTIKKTLMASCAIPVVFKPVVIDNETHYDGGVLDNTPCTPLINHGCTEIILIDLFRFRRKRQKLPHDITVHTIVPSKNLRGILDFRDKSIEHRFQTGIKDAEAFIKKHNQTTSTTP